MSSDSLLEPYPYIDVDDVVSHKPNWRRGNVDHESASWSEDVVGYVSPIHVIEWDIRLLWTLNRFTWKSIICWCGMGCQWSNAMWQVGWREFNDLIILEWENLMTLMCLHY